MCDIRVDKSGMSPWPSHTLMYMYTATPPKAQSGYGAPTYNLTLARCHSTFVRWVYIVEREIGKREMKSELGMQQQTDRLQ